MKSPERQNLSPWGIVVFAARETLDVLHQTVHAASVAACGRAHIDVLVNGNPALAKALANRLANTSNGVSTRVWSLLQSDKANAWNSYIRHVWAGESIAFFIDGYVWLNPDAVRLLGDAVSSTADVLGGTGVPSVGRTAHTMRSTMARSGGFHGNFCCIKGSVIEQLRQRNIALPFGLYRVDALMGTLLSFGLYPERRDWNQRRIFVHTEASWQAKPKHWWRLADLMATIKRTVRQSRGILENEAVKSHFVQQHRTAESLPATAAELVLNWTECYPDQASRTFWHHPLTRRGLTEIKLSIGRMADGLPPTLVEGSGTP